MKVENIIRCVQIICTVSFQIFLTQINTLINFFIFFFIGIIYNSLVFSNITKILIILSSYIYICIIHCLRDYNSLNNACILRSTMIKLP